MLPKLGPRGPVWPPPDQRPITRTYTVRRFDATAGELDIHFVLHDDAGPASNWAARAEPGDFIGIVGPGGPDRAVMMPTGICWRATCRPCPPSPRRWKACPPPPEGWPSSKCPTAGTSSPSKRGPISRSAGFTAMAAPCWRTPCAARHGRKGLFPPPSPGKAAPCRDPRLSAPGTRSRPERDLCRAYWKASLSEEGYHDERHRIMDAME